MFLCVPVIPFRWDMFAPGCSWTSLGDHSLPDTLRRGRHQCQGNYDTRGLLTVAKTILVQLYVRWWFWTHVYTHMYEISVCQKTMVTVGFLCM